MKNFIKFFVILIGGLLIFEAMGKRPDTTMETSFSSDDIPKDMETWLSEKEAKILNLKPNAVKEIIWNDSGAKTKTELSIVYIHGFAATKVEMAPTAQLIAKQLGANLYFTRLSGHGRNNVAMREPTLSDWANDIVEAISIGERLGEKVIIIAGASGATLATWAIRNPEFSKNIIALISVSPNFALNGLSNGVLNMPWAEKILPIIYGDYITIAPQNKQHSADWILEIPVDAVIKLGALLKVVSKTDFSSIKIPHLIFYSTKNKVVSYREAESVLKVWGGPVNAVKIDNSVGIYHHILSGDVLSPNTTQYVVEESVKWIKQHNK